MGSLPRATTNVVETAGAVATGTNLICVMAPVPLSADMVPRVFGGWPAIYAQHGYGEGLEYCALHALRTSLPILFVGLPIETPGVVGRFNSSGNTGTSVVTVAAGASGCLAEHEGVVTVLNTAQVTVGTDQVLLGLSLDGGRTTKRVRLGTATSYTIPYFGVTISATVGTLKPGETVLTWTGTAPTSATSSWTTAREKLAQQLKLFRTALLVGDLPSDTEAAAYRDVLDAYHTANERFVVGRASVYDRMPQAAFGSTFSRMSSPGELTFAEVGGTGDTVTRSTGSWLSDGAHTGAWVAISGTVSNEVEGRVASAASTILTLGSTDLAPESIGNASVVFTTGLVFASGPKTLVRSNGSWFDDGFRSGTVVTIAGTASNNGTKTISVLGVDTIVFSESVADESLDGSGVSITAGQTKAQWAAEVDNEFETIDAAPRIDLSLGRGRVTSPITGWYMRRPAAWAASLREYQHDVHVCTWRKSDGPVGFDLNDADGNLVEYDDRIDGSAASLGRFTSLRTWANGPGGAFVSQSLTRATEGSILSQTHNMVTVNLACTVCQAATERVIGRSLTLNDDGTATSDALAVIEGEVNGALELVMLQNGGEGQRCSKATWTASREDIMNVPEPLLHGTLELNLNGTIHSVATVVRVLSGGQ